MGAGERSDAARKEADTLTRVKLNAPGTERPAKSQAEVLRLMEELKQALLRVADGKYDGMSWAVAVPRIRITPSGLFLDIEWSTVVHTWNHPPCTSESTCRLAETKILPRLPTEMEIRGLESVVLPMSRGPAPGIKETVYGYRLSVRIPGGRRV